MNNNGSRSQDWYLSVSAPHPSNPFIDGSIRGTFETATGKKQWNVEGFCDSEDGSVYRVRFMPPAPGEYIWSIEYRQGWSKKASSGTFHVRDGHRRGLVRIDPENRWHFIWEGTGEHYFFNGTTAYWLMGWPDEQVIQSSIERLHELKINRMRVTVAGRTNVYYGEPVMAGPSWSPLIRPWQTVKNVRLLHILGRIGQRLGIKGGLFDSLANLNFAEDIYHPGFDNDWALLFQRKQGRPLADWQPLSQSPGTGREAIASLRLADAASLARTLPGKVQIKEATPNPGWFPELAWASGQSQKLL